MTPRERNILAASFLLMLVGLGIAYYAYEVSSAGAYVYLPEQITKGYGSGNNEMFQFKVDSQYTELRVVNGRTFTVVDSGNTYYAIYGNPISTVYYLFTGIPPITTALRLADIIGPYSVNHSGNKVILSYGGRKYTYSRGASVSVFTVENMPVTVLAKNYARVGSTSVTGKEVVPIKFEKTMLESATVSCGACVGGTFTVPAVIYVFSNVANGESFSNEAYYNAIESTYRETGWVKTDSTTFYYTNMASGTNYTEMFTFIHDGATSSNSRVVTTSITPLTMLPAFENLPVVNVDGTTIFYDDEHGVGMLVGQGKIVFYRVLVGENSVELMPLGTESIISANYTIITKSK